MLVAVLWVGAGGVVSAQQGEHPRSHDPRIKIELFAENPQIVTPTGIDVDHQGRVWVIESNTHFRPADYKGHPSDRLLVMQDRDGDGKADQVVTFADELTHAMSVAVRPLWFPVTVPKELVRKPAGISVYVATRKEIVLLHDDDGDLKVDRRERIVHLDTPGNYPHNGLAGITFDALGWMYFGLGENLGAEYKIIGTDGTTLSGGGEGGNLYRCRLDGAKLERWATGFWNPHASCFDAFGRLFSVDNDADSKPPCRLLHIIPGGDYGYRFRNGRKGLHPFTSWNGEIPGTLPMVAGTGEAPSGILAYESDGLPEEYIGNLLVTSWGDHRIDRFRLKPKGASFTSVAEPLITGGENFRPVGIATAPDGSLYLSDWVLRDYKLHGKGRVWRVSPVGRAEKRVSVDRTDLPTDLQQLDALTGHRSLMLRRAATHRLVQSEAGRRRLLEYNTSQTLPVRQRIEAYWSVIRAASHPATQSKLSETISQLFKDMPSAKVIDAVCTAQIWLIKEVNFSKQPQVYFEAVVAAPIAADQERNEDHTINLALHYNNLPRLKPDGTVDPTDLVVTDFEEQAADPFWYRMAILEMSRLPPGAQYVTIWRQARKLGPRGKIAMLLGSQLREPPDRSLVGLGLIDGNPMVRRAAVQIAAEQRLVDYRPRIEQTFDTATSSDLFLATLAALEMLDGKNPAEFDKTPAGKYVVPLVKDGKRPAKVRAMALRLVPPGDPALDAGLLKSLLGVGDAGLSREVVRTLQGSPLPEAAELLLAVARDEKSGRELQLEALASLGAHAKHPVSGEAVRHYLLQQLSQKDGGARVESLRGLRGLGADAVVKQGLRGLIEKNGQVGETERDLIEQVARTLEGFEQELPAKWKPAARPTTVEVWDQLLAAGKGDAVAGRRVFFHTNGAGCAKCHTVDGRGGNVGPDLSQISRTASREKLLQSILEPSREVAPQFTAWSMETKAGKTISGMVVHENEGKTVLGDADGKLIEVKTIDIVERIPQQKSVMPDKLADRLTVQEFRDLLAYLATLQ